MSGDEQLATAFLAAHPEVAAKLLESMRPEDASEVLASTSAQAASAVLHHMLPTSSARCAEQLSESVVAELLEHLPSLAGAALLRHLPAGARNGVLARMTPARKTALSLLLRYPASAVGAWMEPRVLTLPEDCTIEDARGRLQRHESVEPRVYVLDRTRRIRGAVRGPQLLRTEWTGRLAPLLEPADALWAREAVAAAQGRELWERESEAPVVNREDEFVGVVTYSSIRRGLKEATSRVATDARHNEAGELAELFFSGLEDTWKSLTEILRDDQPR